MVGAIAAGNCVMVKPGSYAPACSHAIARLVHAYLDQSCVRVAEGDRAVTTALLDERFDKICFTGSGYVGKLILEKAAKHLTPCLLELGGKSPCVVDASANLQHAAERLVWGTFLNAGQTCVRPDFLLVHAAVAEQFLPMLKRTIGAFYGADAQASEWYGRVINDKAWCRLDEMLRAAPPKVVYHGGRTDRADLFIEPTILDYGADAQAFLASEAMADEIFGPILPTLRYTDLEEARARARPRPDSARPRRPSPPRARATPLPACPPARLPTIRLTATRVHARRHARSRRRRCGSSRRCRRASRSRATATRPIRRWCAPSRRAPPLAGCASTTT